MKWDGNDLILQNRVFIWIALATVLILLIPLIAMRLTAEVNWDTTDFIIMGVLMYGVASLFVLVARRAPRRHRVLIGGAFITAFLFVWAEFAVGVFTNLGS